MASTALTRLLLLSLGASIFLTGAGSAPKDNTGPKVLGFELASRRLDISSGASRVEFEVTLDDPSGIQCAQIGLRGPEGQYARYEWTDSRAWSREGSVEVWRGYQDLSPYLASGQWLVELYACDGSWNSTWLSPAELTDLGFDPVVTVINDDEDLEPPAVESLSLSEAQVDVSQGPATVTIEGRFTDDRSGARSLAPYLRRDDGSYSFAYSEMELVSGHLREGRWAVQLVVPRGQPAGTYELGFIYVGDAAGNQRSIQPHELREEIAVGTLEIVNDAAPRDDHEGPVVTGVDLSPTEVDLSRGPVRVAVEVTLSDPSGVRQASALLQSHETGQSRWLPLRDWAVDGSSSTWRGTTVLDRYAAEGDWRLIVMAEDGQYNYSYTDAEHIEAIDAGPSRVRVTNVNADETPPVLLALDVPTAVDTRDGPVTLPLSARLADDLSGAAWLQVWGPTYAWFEFDHGSRLDGTWTAQTTAQGSGTYWVSATAWDLVGNSVIWGPDELDAMGLPSSVELGWSPMPPTDVSATPVGDATSVLVAWEAPVPDSADVRDITGYRILRNGEVVGETGPGATSFTDRMVLPLLRHTYTVLALSVVGPSSPSASVCTSTHEATTGLVC